MQVRFDAVTKQFQTKKGCITAVDHLSLTIGSGKLIGFLGPSGCGKTTSLFMISGIHPLTEGRILFDETDVTALSPEKRGVGMVFQNYALYPHLSVRENIEFPLVNSREMKKRLMEELSDGGKRSVSRKRFKDSVAERVHEVARLVEISEYLDRKPSELSGGQQQRVAIARAIVKRPSILLLDEPLSNLDARLRVQTREEIRSIQRRTGITTVFVTHDQEEALNLCDEIAIMKNGVLQQYGAPQDVYDNPANLFVAEFLGGTKINLFEARAEAGIVFIGDLKIRGDIPVADGRVTLGIRPENLLSCAPEDGGGLTARVERLIRLGGVTTVEAVLPGGESLRLMKENGSTLKPGDTIGLKILPGAVCLFAEGGEKIWQG
ncbi:MAG: ABC transporter ATP-binding protein [Clostridiales bacterium]|nr:ABC transporter ATP-binding protein [Clostridiales bacterium]